MVKTYALILAFLLTSSLHTQQDPNRFESVMAGFSLVKPSTWQFASLEFVARNRATAKLTDEQLQKRLENAASVPLVVVIKHQEPYEGLNPSFQVTLRPIPPTLQGSRATDMLKVILPTLRSAFSDFTLESQVTETLISGVRAAEMTARYTVRTKQGGEFPTRGKMVVMPRGKFMFLISMSGPLQGPDDARTEFDRILKSVTIVNE